MLEFAKENNYTCVDLCKLTMDLYNKLGEETSKKFHMIFGPNLYNTYIEGKDDQRQDRRVHEDQDDPHVDSFQWLHLFHAQSFTDRHRKSIHRKSYRYQKKFC